MRTHSAIAVAITRITIAVIPLVKLKLTGHSAVSRTGARRRMATLSSPLRLPVSPQTLPNRVVKSAMSESLASRGGRATGGLTRLYGTWAGLGGAGTLITGNAMVDAGWFVEPRNVVLDVATRASREDVGDVRRMVEAGKGKGKSGGATVVVLVQLNHPGRVAAVPVLATPVAPSPVAVGLPVLRHVRVPRALTEDEIKDLVRRFADAAEMCVNAGANGVQIHAAHGYLLSQFLSPLANKRDGPNERYGGSPAKRRQLLLDVAQAIRARVGNHPILSVKLNASDFQRGGFSVAESIEVCKALEATHTVDFIELSGGNYEEPCMVGLGGDGPDVQADADRGAYFVTFARALKRECPSLIVMLTGGIRSGAFAEACVARGDADLIGVGRPFAAIPDAGARLLRGETLDMPPCPRVGIKPIDGFLEIAWASSLMAQMANGATQPDTRFSWSVVELAKVLARHGFKSATQFPENDYVAALVVAGMGLAGMSLRSKL